MDSLEGKTAVVTGAASGMGKAFAVRFAQAGMNVVLSDIEEPALDAALAEVAAATAEGRDALAVRTDVSQSDEVDDLAARAIDAFGIVNVVCNNAGVGGSLGGVDVDLKTWRWIMDVNFWGVVNGHASFLPHLLSHGDGHIVNTASMAGHMPGHGAYSAAKWAVVGITEGLYRDLANTGSTVGVSCLCPGWVDTKIHESERNRPEWAAPAALDEPDPMAETIRAYVADLLASGASPASVADLVHDAIVADQFWIFTDHDMVAGLQPRYDAVLGHTNPPTASIIV